MQLGALLGTVYIVQETDAIFMTTQGGPGTLTTNLPYRVYETAYAEARSVAARPWAYRGATDHRRDDLLLRSLDRMLRGQYADRKTPRQWISQ